MPAAALTAVAALALGATAQAQDATQDPSPGSPGGTIYEIPLDQGRGDAAPRGGGSQGGGSGGSGSGAATATPGTSSIRSSDNGSSSTAVVPRTSGKSGDRHKRKSGGGKDGAASERAIVPPAPQTQVAAAGSGSPSVKRSVLLIALGAAIAAGLGLAARQAARRDG